jgi:glycosyltransferase involved in cell wall biosynthesis
MNSNVPKISVIVPTYNRAAMLGGCIEAVLAQTMQDFELVIVSDGSTDATKEVVLGYNDPRILFFEKENGGQASARN